MKLYRKMFESETLPKPFAKRRSMPPAPLLCSLITERLESAELAKSQLDPEAQAELVYQAIQKLDQVRQLVVQLPELPLGDRQDLLAQLGATLENLRALYFLDAIY